jgi:hypothetical protein
MTSEEFEDEILTYLRANMSPYELAVFGVM